MSDFRIKKGVLVEYTGKGGDAVIPDSVTSIGEKAFWVCSNLTSITIPNSVTSIGEWAFAGCSGLTSISIPDSVTSIGKFAFYGCNGLTDQTGLVIVRGVLYSYEGDAAEIEIPDSVTSIGDEAFEGCSSLTSIALPGSVTSIGDEAFEGCSSLTSIALPDSVTSIGNNAFEGCSSLTGIALPDSVTSIGNGAFLDCNSLTSINIPDSVMSIGEEAFFGCDGLADQNGMVIIRNVLHYYKGNATSIEIPDTVTSIEIEAFMRCSSLTSITIPNSVTSIGEGAFSGCSSLTSITIPDSVTSIGEDVFSGCSSLTSITIPDSVTSIGFGAFSYCRSLTSITIPDSVTSIGYSAFDNCTNLENFTCPSPLASQLKNALLETRTPSIIHFPNISDLSTQFRPNAAVGFAEDNRDCTDENGKAYVKYIKANAAKLAGVAIEHPALFYLMLREKLISAKDLEAFTKTVQDSGNTELIAAILDYANSSVSEKDKAKVQQKKETLDTNVTNFLFDAEQIEQISGKTFAVTGKLKTFASRDELKACLEACGATLTESLSRNVNYLITNTPDSDTEKNRKAKSLHIRRITEEQFNKKIGRKVQK